MPPPLTYSLSLLAFSGVVSAARMTSGSVRSDSQESGLAGVRGRTLTLAPRRVREDAHRGSRAGPRDRRASSPTKSTVASSLLLVDDVKRVIEGVPYRLSGPSEPGAAVPDGRGTRDDAALARRDIDLDRIADRGTLRVGPFQARTSRDASRDR